MKTKNLFLLTFITLTMFLFSSCATSDSDSDEAVTTEQKVSMDLSVAFPEQSSSFLGKALGTFSDVDSVLVTVTDGTITYANNQAMTDSGGVWSTTVTSLPVDLDLTFTADAFNGATKIFSGSKTTTILSGGSAVAIDMGSIDDAASNVLPSITKILRSLEVARGDSSNVDFDFRGNISESLDWVITTSTANYPGTFATGSGTAVMSGSGIATVDNSYTAASDPDAVGEKTHSIKLTNSQGNWVKNQFSNTVIHETATGTITTNFSPVVTALGGERSGTDVTWEATVDDGDGTVVSYAWSYSGTGSIGFANNTVNPVTMTDYDATAVGVITLVITDDDGLNTTVAYQLVADQFPDSVIVDQ